LPTYRPWWQGSIYQNRIIHLQPVRVLRERGVLETTLRHELAHQLVDERARENCPAWLNEALAIYNSGEIAWLKPNTQIANGELLTWQELDRRLHNINGKEATERLYFQLYHLGRFLESLFQPRQMAALIHRLGGSTPLEQACREVLGMSAEGLEQRWLKYWADLRAK
jgi:hypothetical protein